MFKQDDRFRVPTEDATIWRYMNFERFKDLVEREALYFCAIDKLKKEDPYEGSQYACKLLSQAPLLAAQQFAAQVSQCGPTIAVNCWHANESDSVAMWKIYAGQGKSVALRSSFGRLVESLSCVSDDIHGGFITYTDEPIPHPTGAEGDKFMACMTKRKCFDFERELRTFVWDTSSVTRTDDGSAYMPVDLSRLIESVYVSPTAAGDTLGEITSFLGERGLIVNVQKSSILDQPPY
ncbi:MAG: hypothetical protein A2Y76_02665 [Planctomycetes bacterium RBG_13_60_9]|nr:MAG: hypothetical protein A2Y76_02665 [Planctomycetes bacterium RBG_13_60_9]